MIYERRPWKRQFRNDADLLKRWAGKPSTERRAFLLESKILDAARRGLLAQQGEAIR
jgi:hypothetical protein